MRLTCCYCWFALRVSLVLFLCCIVCVGDGLIVLRVLALCVVLCVCCVVALLVLCVLVLCVFCIVFLF